MTPKVNTIAVVGAGAWGTALAANAAQHGSRTIIWGRNGDVVDEINSLRKNQAYLGEATLPSSLKATTALDKACTDADIVLLCVPAQMLGKVAADCAEFVDDQTVLVSCAKGIDRDSGRRMTQVIADAAPKNPVAVLSGPSFADDVVRFLPTAVTIAAHDTTKALHLANALSNATLRCYASDDIKGVEIGGALKNVLAIAIGIARGLGLGASAEAALIARGFAEMSRIADAFGGRAETLAGLSGLGDLVLTCSSDQSRNFSYGIAVAQGKQNQIGKLVEGAFTARIAHALAQQHAIDAPITGGVTAILDDKASVWDVVASLLARPIKSE